MSEADIDVTITGKDVTSTETYRRLVIAASPAAARVIRELDEQIAQLRAAADRVRAICTDPARLTAGGWVMVHADTILQALEPTEAS